MNIVVKNNLKRNVANFFGAFGYLSCSLQWLWAFALNFSAIKTIVTFVTPNTTSVIVKPNAAIDMGQNIFLMILGIVITIIVLSLTVYIIVKIPSTIVKTSKKAVNKAAENITPLVLRIQHQKDSKKRHIKLTSRLVLIIKMVLIVVPVVLSFVSQFAAGQVFDFYIAMYVCVWLASFSAIFFISQYVLASILSVKRQNLW